MSVQTPAGLRWLNTYSFSLAFATFLLVWFSNVFFQDEIGQGDKCAPPRSTFQDSSANGTQVLRGWPRTSSYAGGGASCKSTYGASLCLYLTSACAKPAFTGGDDGALNLTVVRLVQKVVPKECCPLRHVRLGRFESIRSSGVSSIRITATTTTLVGHLNVGGAGQAPITAGSAAFATSSSDMVHNRLVEPRSVLQTAPGSDPTFDPSSLRLKQDATQQTVPVQTRSRCTDFVRHCPGKPILQHHNLIRNRLETGSRCPKSVRFAFEVQFWFPGPDQQCLSSPSKAITRRECSFEWVHGSEPANDKGGHVGLRPLASFRNPRV